MVRLQRNARNAPDAGHSCPVQPLRRRAFLRSDNLNIDQLARQLQIKRARARQHQGIRSADAAID